MQGGRRNRSGAEEEVPGGGMERLSCGHCSATTAIFLLITSPHESGDMEPIHSVWQHTGLDGFSAEIRAKGLFKGWHGMYFQ